MPTPSHNAPDPPSSRLHPFSSCPDPEEPEEQPSQPASSESATSPESPSPSRWQRLPSPSHPAAANRPARPDRTVARDPRPPAMSPGPQPEDAPRDTDMGHEPEGLVGLRGDAADRHSKPADADDEMSPVRGGTARGPATGRDRRVGGGPGERTSTATPGEPPGRRKANAGGPAPAVGEVEEVAVWGPGRRGPRWVEDSGLAGLGLEYSHMRVVTPAPSLYLQPGSRFVGTQQSERQRYDVEVELKHVDMRESFLCGYLRIQGLTDDHPTLTTYFEGEIIGTKYGFITQRPGWGATEKIDLSHWSQFTAFRPYIKQARKGSHAQITDVDQRENIFMRWKEHFLVPDHRVRTINGASFEGFYYICFNQVKGEVNGIYFHSKSEKFQQLELKYVENKGCYGAMEFR